MIQIARDSRPAWPPEWEVEDRKQPGGSRAWKDRVAIGERTLEGLGAVATTRRRSGARLTPHRPSLQAGASRSDGDHALCRRTFLPLDHQEFHLLSLCQGLEALALDGGVVHEDIITSLALNETEAFGIVEPLDGASFAVCHVTDLSPVWGRYVGALCSGRTGVGAYSVQLSSTANGGMRCGVNHRNDGENRS